MSRRRLWPIGLSVVVFAVAIPLFLILRKQHADDDLEVYLEEAGFRAAACPGGEPFGRPDMGAVRCFAGKLRGGSPVTLLLGKRWQAESVNIPKGSGIAQESYIAVELASPGDPWVQRWRARLGRGGQDPVRVAATGDRVVLVWRGLHRRDEVQGRLELFSLTLP